MRGSGFGFVPVQGSDLPLQFVASILLLAGGFEEIKSLRAEYELKEKAFSCSPVERYSVKSATEVELVNWLLFVN
jgi:hypothetical protein